MFTHSRDFKYAYEPTKSTASMVMVLVKGNKYEAGFEHKGVFLTIPCSATDTDEQIGAAIRESLK